MFRIFKFKQDDVRGPLAVLISFVVIFGSIISLYLAVRPRHARFSTIPYEEMGRSAVKKVAELAGPRAQVVTWRLRFPSVMPMIDSSLQAFQNEMQQSTEMKIIGSEETTLTETMPVMDMGEGMMDGAQFRALLEKYPQADVLVMFGGSPALRDEEFKTLPPHRPKVVILAVSTPPQKKLFKENVVQAAVVPRFQAIPDGSTEPRTSAEWFDRYFVFVSADTADQLPW